jgi:hypothetical protein
MIMDRHTETEAVRHMTPDDLHVELSRVALRYRQRRQWRALVCVAGPIFLLAVAAVIAVALGLLAPTTVLWLLALLVIGTVVALIWSRNSFQDSTQLATNIEEAFPDLEQRLLTLVGKYAPASNTRLSYLQQVLLDETVAHARSRRWQRTVPLDSITRTKNIFLLLATAIMAAMLTAFSVPVAEPLPVVAKESEPEVLSDLGKYVVQIAPGNIELERGTHLTVTAKFDQRIPAQAALVLHPGDTEQLVPMSRSLDDPLFGAHVAEVSTDTDYVVRYDDQTSERFHVTVFDFPNLLRSDALLTYPQYTHLPTKEIENTRRVSAVEGTSLAWICHLNKSVVVAQLVDEGGHIVRLKEHPTVPNAYVADIELKTSTRWELQLVDDRDRHNKHEIFLSATVLPNREPELKLELARDVRVSPLEELPVQASVTDDFGVQRVGVSFGMPGQTPQEITLAEALDPKEQRALDHLFDFEALNAAPDQLLSYHFWVEDIGPDGNPRRVFSDMFFAEVRPFEEIFREGEQPTESEMAQQRQQQQQQQQGQQNAQRADQLAELQKNIISATWTIIRRETAAEPTPQFADDVTVVIESQNDALTQLEELSGELTDEKSLNIAETARLAMEQTVQELIHARDSNAPKELSQALISEQAIYQALLGLRAREHEVIRGEQQQQGQQSGSGSSSSRQQQQLNELQLNNDRNRYETEQQAQTQEQNEQTAQDRQAREVVDRLAELARRQQDLNRRLQELQSALDEAQTEEEREQLERELKRLRDQQEELLRDTDELSEQVDSQQNQATDQANTQQQLEQTREDVQRTAEALSQQDVSEALSSGTRAERQFDQMREELRQQTSERFTEGVRDMRNQARELANQQEEIGNQLEQTKQEAANSLRDSESRQALQEQLATQQEQLNQLLDQIQQTVLDAEQQQPLLAEKLYDTYRDTTESDLQQRLETMEQMVERGLLEPTQQLNDGAQQRIDDLRQGLESAAESVLGDETESLRRAANELESLSRELNEEIQRATGRQDGQQQDGQQQNGQQQNGQQQNGQQQNGQQQNGQQQNGQQQDGQQQDGQQQDGQQQDGQQQDGQQQDGQQQDGQQQDGQQQDGQQQDGQKPNGQQQNGQQQNGQQQNGQQQNGQQQNGQQQNGQQQNGQQQNGQQQNGQQPNGQQPNGQQQGRGATSGQRQADGRDGGGGAIERFGESLGTAPLTGDDYRQWSDRLRDVEQIIDDPELRSEATRIRERARAIRLEFQRHSKEPEWPLVDRLVAQPLESLQQRVSEELLKRTGEQNARVPIDRDPVPDEFTEQVQRYYERLGGAR